MKLPRIQHSQLFDESLEGEPLILEPGDDITVKFSRWRKLSKYIHQIQIVDKKGNLIKSQNTGLVFFRPDGTWDVIEPESSLYYIKQEIKKFLFFNGSSHPIAIAEIIIRDEEHQSVWGHEVETSIRKVNKDG